jgi:hypothetical protein
MKRVDATKPIVAAGVLPREEADRLDWAERVESIKAGGIGALAAGLAWGNLTIAHIFIAPTLITQPFIALALAPVLGNAPLSPPSSTYLPASAAIALFSGFLFGITYRYIIRQDRNPHLKSGAVGAFGLVRGLAQSEASLRTIQDLLPAAIALGESLVLFAIVRLALDWALQKNWLKPFPSPVVQV